MDAYDEDETADDSATIGMADDSIEELRTRTKPRRPALPEDDPDLDGDDGLSAYELVEERLTIDVVPQQADEFTCDSCFLVLHRSQISTSRHRTCVDCAD